MGSEVNLITDRTIGGDEADDDWKRGLRMLDSEVEEVVLLPDMTYPYHPSTGMVADPAVVNWLVTALREHTTLTPRDITILCATSGEISTEMVISLLGYDVIASEQGINLVHASESSELLGRVRDWSVVTVLSPRFSSNGQGPLTHSRFFDELDRIDSTGLRANIRFSLLDATFLNCGHSYNADRVFLSRDPDSIDGAISTLFGTGGTTAFNEKELQRIASDLDVESPSEAGIGDAVLKFGYQLYAKASGDVVPPQMEN